MKLSQRSIIIVVQISPHYSACFWLRLRDCNQRSSVAGYIISDDYFLPTLLRSTIKVVWESPRELRSNNLLVRYNLRYSRSKGAAACNYCYFCFLVLLLFCSKFSFFWLFSEEGQRTSLELFLNSGGCSGWMLTKSPMQHFNSQPQWICILVSNYCVQPDKMRERCSPFE